MQSSIGKSQQRRTPGCVQGLTGNLICSPVSLARGTLFQRLDGRRSRSRFPSRLVPRGHDPLGRSCLVSNQSWIPTRSSARRPGYRNPPVLLISSCKTLTFSTRAEPIRFPSAQPFVFIFKCSFPVFQPELSPRNGRAGHSLPPAQGPAACWGICDVFNTQIVLPCPLLPQK